MKYFVLAFVFLLLILGGLVMYKVFQDRLTQKNLEIATLQEKVDIIDEMTIVYRLTADVKSGNECYDYELEPIEVPISAVSDTNIISDTDIIGKHYKLNLKQGTWLVKELFEDFIVTKDMRKMDVVFDEIPIGLEAGDYIDVRISFPLGQDYIALSHKRVDEINGSTVKLIVEQRDFYMYESMKTDIATYRSTKIYGAQYLEAGIQEAATTYYPVNLEVLKTMLLDPNMSTGDYSEILKLRKQLEEQLSTSARVEISDTVTSGRTAISQKFADAEEQYRKIQLEKERNSADEKRKAERSNADSNNTENSSTESNNADSNNAESGNKD
jgi:hypothetical protein